MICETDCGGGEELGIVVEVMKLVILEKCYFIFMRNGVVFIEWERVLWTLDINFYRYLDGIFYYGRYKGCDIFFLR